MNLFRNLLFWLVLALAGALVAQLLVQDPGQVVVSFRGMDYRFTVVAGLLMLAAVLLGLWLLWAVVTLPFRGWRGFRSRRERARLTDGLDAFDRGEWARAEKLLAVINVKGNWEPTLDYAACQSRGIFVLSIAPAMAQAVAEWSLGAAIDLGRGLTRADRDFRAGTERYANPYAAAERGFVDDVIDPAETRRKIVAGLRVLRSKREDLPQRKHGNVPL